ncbi:hypothetical protein [Marinifilum flexuosum]|uniref:hypothetical protein n=2 Tax=Marinifilum flexuosum TaxID=1117708 RepID=UPI002492E6B3|nr:hypothetical protein [Marinifilum flexuosum]
MNKILRFIISGVVALGIYYVGFYIYEMVRFSHNASWERYKEYTWILDDSIQKDLNTGVSRIGNSDTWNFFRFRDVHMVTAWEFTNLQIEDLGCISIHKNEFIPKDDIKSGETFDSNSSPKTTCKYGFDLAHRINVKIDNQSEVQRMIEADNYKGFIGRINKLSLSNKYDESQIIFDFEKSGMLSMFLFYKKKDDFYVILYYSRGDFDEEIIDKLKLV